MRSALKFVFLGIISLVRSIKGLFNLELCRGIQGVRGHKNVDLDFNPGLTGPQGSMYNPVPENWTGNHLVGLGMTNREAPVQENWTGTHIKGLRMTDREALEAVVNVAWGDWPDEAYSEACLFVKAFLAGHPKAEEYCKLSHQAHNLPKSDWTPENHKIWEDFHELDKELIGWDWNRNQGKSDE